MVAIGNINNTRILRFFIVLGAVIITIFIYASYSTNTSLTPSPHVRGLDNPHADYLTTQQQQQQLQKQQHNTSTRGVGGEVSLNSTAGSAPAALQQRLFKGSQKKTATVNRLRHVHREPTVDKDAENAVGDSDGDSVLNDVPDEIVLERLVNNELLEEQYMQNVDGVLGTANGSAMVGNVLVQTVTQLLAQQQQPLQPQEHEQSNIEQQKQIELVDSKLNRIPDSDVLIPTSSLQKFIENADKILKNISTPVATNKPEKQQTKAATSSKDSAKQPLPQSKRLTNVNNENGEAPGGAEEDTDDDEALPPSAVMKIKQPVAAAASPPKEKIEKGKDKATTKTAPSNGNTTSNLVYSSQGIPTQAIYESGHMNEEINADKLCPHRGAELKLLILITSAQDHMAARLAIRQTWGHYGTRRDVSTAFVLGRNSNETINKALTQENYIYGDLIRGNFIDSYNNLTLKTISSLEWVHEHCPLTKYILKTDDDMFINVPKLLAFIDSHGKEKRVIFGRLAKKWKPVRNKKSKYYVSPEQFSAAVFPSFTTGPAYLLSGDIVHELYLRSLQSVYLKLEDVFTTGIVAQQLSVKRLHSNEFLNRRIALNPCNIRKAISVHMIKANEQFDLWKKLLDQSTKCK